MENDQDEARKRTAVACTLAVVTAALAVAPWGSLPSTAIPMRTSILLGQMWLDELLTGHPECFREQFGMSKSTFQLLSRELQLHSGLAGRRYVMADEQLATFLYLARTGSGTRVLQERLQRSPSTIGGYVKLFSLNHNTI